MSTKPRNFFKTHSHEEVVEKFITPWRRRKNVLGALLVGSYAAGLQTPQSDIDICIVLQKTVKHWRRGNLIVSGFLLEYLAYPITYLKQLQKIDLKEGARLRTRMLAMGKILFDKTGVIHQLQKEARQLLKKKMPPQNKELVEMYKYRLWDQLDNLGDLAKQNVSAFNYSYYASLQDILRFYAAFLRFEMLRPARIHRFFTDTKFRKLYGIAPLPDKAFSKLFERAMHEPSLRSLERITEHVHKRMGGFTINGWTLRRRVPRSY